MARKILNNKPLVEAIFELRWNLKEVSPNSFLDPHYKILIGSMYEKLKHEYPYPESLPSASIPEHIASYIVQQRFRKAENKWPLIQIGPGIITLNDTEGYVWEDFEQRLKGLLEAFYEVYPEVEKLHFNSLILRYIDAIDFDYVNDNILTFLQQYMDINVSLKKDLFTDASVRNNPINFDLSLSFPCSEPNGAISLRFVSGQKDGKESFLWETIVQAANQETPKTKGDILNWLDRAHSLSSDWFFKIIQGELERRFE